MTSDQIASVDKLFLRLRKPTFQEMRQLYINWLRDRDTVWTNDERSNFFDKHGWSVREFVIACQSSGGNLPHD